MTWNADGTGGAPPLIDLGATPTARRFVRFAGVPPVAALCTAGVDADAVTPAQSDPGGTPDPGLVNQTQGYLAIPGLPVQVEAGAAFSAGATLQSDATGRAIAWASGSKVARALGAASGAGSIVWVSFLSGR